MKRSIFHLPQPNFHTGDKNRNKQIGLDSAVVNFDMQLPYLITSYNLAVKTPIYIRERKLNDS